MSIEEMKKRPDHFDDGFGEDSLGGIFERLMRAHPFATVFSAIVFNLIAGGAILALMLATSK